MAAIRTASRAHAKSFDLQARQVFDTEPVLETRHCFEVLTFLWFAAN